jgi:hypothetical protein
MEEFELLWPRLYQFLKTLPFLYCLLNCCPGSGQSEGYYIYNVAVMCAWWRYVVAWLGCSAQVQMIQDLSPGHTLSISTCSPVKLDWFIQSRVVVDCLWFVHVSLLGIIGKEWGISTVPDFQFWPKSKSLGLSGTQQLWCIMFKWANAEDEEDGG